LTRIVLAVEDDLQEQLMIARAVADFGGKTKLVTVDTGGDALDYIARRGPYEWRRLRENPHMVIADHELPDMHGFELVRILREMEAAKALPVWVYAEEPDAAISEYEGFLVDGPGRKHQEEAAFRGSVVAALERNLGR
jgi:CheY-like chemotaxis protein